MSEKGKPLKKKKAADKTVVLVDAPIPQAPEKKGDRKK